MDFFKSLWSLNKAFSSYTMPMHEMIDKSISQNLFNFQRAIVHWIFLFYPWDTLSIPPHNKKSNKYIFVRGYIKPQKPLKIQAKLRFLVAPVKKEVHYLYKR